MARRKKSKKTSEKKVEKDIKETEEKASKKQVKSENRILRNFLIGLGVFVALILVLIFINFNSSKFNYRGVNFEIEKFCDAGPCLTVYRTDFPVLISNGGQDISVVEESRKNADYNIYIRNDPRELEEKVPFNGFFNIRNLVVLNQTKDFYCEGYGAIAIENFLKQRIFNIEIISDSNATCDSEGRYTFINIREGNKTSITQVGPSCYQINIKECEILEGTERFMIETFVRANEVLQEGN